MAAREPDRRFEQKGICGIAVAGRIAAPGERRLRVRRAEGTMIDRRGGTSIHVGIRVQLLRALDAAATHLQRPVTRRVIGKAYRGRVELAGFDVVAPFVGLATAKHRALELYVVHNITEGDHAISDVRRIEPM